MVRIACGSLYTFAAAALLLSVMLCVDEARPSRDAGDDEDPSSCHDDPSWSAYGGGLYTCEWLEKFDPGCRANACGSAADFGQCRACPHACRRCDSAPVAPPPLPPLPPPSPELPLALFDAVRNATTVASEAKGEELPPTGGATAAFAVAALVAAAILGVAVGVLEQRSDSGSLLMARRLALALVGVYALVGLLAVRLMSVAPERCVVAYQRIVPYTRASAELGEVIRFRYSQTRQVYVVLITEHSFDLFARSCSPYSLCLSLGVFGLVLHLAVTRGLYARTRETRRQQKIIERVLDARSVTTIAQLRAAAAAQAAAQAAALCSDQVPDTTPMLDALSSAAAVAASASPVAAGVAPATGTASSSAGQPADASCAGGGAEGSAEASDVPHAAAPSGAATASSASPAAATAGLAPWNGWQGDETPECPICLEAYEADEEIVVLPCRHLLHRACLLSWTKARMISTSCPLCKASLLPEGAVIEEDCELRCCRAVRHVLSGAALAPPAAAVAARPAGTAMV